MKFRSFLFNLFIGLTTLIFGLAWVGVYQFFLGSYDLTEPDMVSIRTQEEAVEFDINDPESVLPLNFEEDKLTSPKVDETNEAMFDPEGYYRFLEEQPKDFDEFFYISIKNKNFDVDSTDKKYGDPVPPKGFVILQDKDDVEYIDFNKINIGNGKIQIETESQKGIKYEFDGEFLVRGNFYTLDEDAKVLKGTLVKKRNGDVIAKSDVMLGWSLEIGCLH